MTRFLAGKTSKASWPKTVQSATGEKRTGKILSNSERNERKKREKKKEDRSTYCVTTKWFSAAQQLIESEINCVFLCSLLAATQ